MLNEFQTCKVTWDLCWVTQPVNSGNLSNELNLSIDYAKYFFFVGNKINKIEQSNFLSSIRINKIIQKAKMFEKKAYNLGRTTQQMVGVDGGFFVEVYANRTWNLRFLGVNAVHVFSVMGITDVMRHTYQLSLVAKMTHRYCECKCISCEFQLNGNIF